MADTTIEANLHNQNYSRMCCLLMEEGTRRAQEVTLIHLPERQSLAQALSDNHDKLDDLMKKHRIITRSQYEALYPFTGDMSKIDISLWLVLARNITTKRSRKGINWAKSPERHETLWAHDLIRLREIRNFLFHVSAPELVGEKYVEIKTDLIQVLRRLGSSDDVINAHMTRDLDPQQTKIRVLQIREQYMEEQNILLHQAAAHKKHTRILTVVLSLLAVLVLIGVTLPVSWYLSQQTPCSKYLKFISTEAGTFYFMPRSGWKALPMKEPDTTPKLKKPVGIAAVFHTATVSYQKCAVTEDCCLRVKDMQIAHMHSWADIGYNYLVGSDGVIYEGRGSLYEGAASWGRNREIISIAIIGNYACAWPSDVTMMALYVFLDYIKRNDPANLTSGAILQWDYSVYGHCQINIPHHNITFPDSPGTGVMQKIMFWEHWDSDNVTKCVIEKDCLLSTMCCKKYCGIVPRD